MIFSTGPKSLLKDFLSSEIKVQSVYIFLIEVYFIQLNKITFAITFAALKSFLIKASSPK